MIILLRRSLLLLFGTATLGTFAGCKPPATQMPAARRPLEMTLHARTTVYALDLHEQSTEEYRTGLSRKAELFRQKGRGFFEDGGTLPPAPVVDLELEIRNTTSTTIQFFVGGSSDRLFFEILGPDVIRVAGPPRQPPPLNWERPSTVVTLAAGESYFEMIASLESVQPFSFYRDYWTRPGEYLIRVSRVLPNSEMAPGGPILACAPVPVRVVASPNSFWNEK